MIQVVIFHDYISLIYHNFFLKKEVCMLRLIGYDIFGRTMIVGISCQLCLAMAIKLVVLCVMS
jgi:hypothetical protein